MLGDISEFLSHTIWAVVGVSNNTAKYGYKVYIQLKKAGYTVYAINPGLKSIEEDPCYPSLAALPTRPDAVSVVVPPKITEQVIKDCIELGINRVWMQPGSESEEAIRNCEKHGIAVIHDQCVIIQSRDKVI
ncbi:CoA binding domain protein [Candidatus Desulfosporosinus infrequens]|uniref:CoA binding domain protein n=1 Tax=Candidatus Desulfosporosinus infrequens TaxID=2043169 RepID=A0A2U3JWQ6_9FIRM|nr:CoA binding domain protein [Candidatus Desulfosporosinus infrequens]